MSETETPIETKHIQKERFIVLESDTNIARDCATGINYHLQSVQEAAGLAATFNLLYAHSAELEVKCHTTELANAELRNTITSLKLHIDTMEAKLLDLEIDLNEEDDIPMSEGPQHHG